MRFSESVLIAWLVGAAACARARDHSAGSAPSTSPLPALTTAAPPPLTSARSASSGSPAPTGGALRSPTGSAYFGCGEPIPAARLWDETTEAEVGQAISAAKACAAEHGRKLLLEFVAPWCADCQEMAKLDQTPVVAETMKARFERVRINVGKWDRHEVLRGEFGVRALATYVVIEPKTSEQLAKTTLEPVTKQGPQLRAEDWARWLRSY